MRTGLIVLTGFWFATAAFAQPATIAAQAPQAMADAMHKLGYRAELASDNMGDPLIRSAASGLKYGIYFYGCEDHKDCTTIQFYLSLDMDRPIPLTVLNDWNRNKRFATAAMDDDNLPYIKMDINLDFGGITLPAFADNLELWKRVMTQFADHIGFNDDAPPPEQTAPKSGPSKDL
jgi:hypothetical protein